MKTFTRGEAVEARSVATKQIWVPAEIRLVSPNYSSIALELENCIHMRDYTGGMAIVGVVPLMQSDEGEFTDIRGHTWEVEAKP